MAEQDTIPTEEVKLDVFEEKVKGQSAKSSIHVPQGLAVEAGMMSQEQAPEAAWPSKSKKCFKKWEKHSVSAPFTIAVALAGAPDSGQDFIPNPNMHGLLLFFVILRCFFSITGIVLSNASRDVSDPFHVTEFFVLFSHWHCSSMLCFWNHLGAFHGFSRHYLALSSLILEIGQHKTSERNSINSSEHK